MLEINPGYPDAVAYTLAGRSNRRRYAGGDIPPQSTLTGSSVPSIPRECRFVVRKATRTVNRHVKTKRWQLKCV